MIRLKIKDENKEDVAMIYLEVVDGKIEVKEGMSCIKPSYSMEIGKVGQLSATVAEPLNVNVSIPSKIEPDIGAIAKSISKGLNQSMINNISMSDGF